MTDFAGLRPSLDKVSLSGVERLPYQDGPPQEQALDTFELVDKCSTRRLSVVSESAWVADATVTKPKRTLFGSIVGRILRALCLNSAA